MRQGFGWRRWGAAVALALAACAGGEETAPEAPSPEPGGCAGGDCAAPEPAALAPKQAELPAVCREVPNKAVADFEAKIYYGTRAPTHVPLTEAQQMAVVGIGFGSPRGASCSGTLITDRFVLTAAHCTRGSPGTGFYALFGRDDQDPVLAVRSVRKHEHPSHDMTLLELAFPPGERIDVEPIPIDAGDLGPSDIGVTLEQAGYGQTERGFANGRFFVTEPLVDFTNGDRYLVVDGEGRRGVCFGDSGGPSMRVTAAGEARVVGALSGGDSSCVGRDRYARTDVVRDWIEARTGPTPPDGAGRGDGDGACGDVDAAGVCSADRAEATYCDGGRLRVDRCPEGLRCGWSAADEGWRCVVPADDPCEGIGRYGTCDGDTLRYCEEGELRIRPCDLCGERCVLAGAVEGYACVPVEGLADADGDDVPDGEDLCSGTPAGARVWRQGEWLGCAGGQIRDRDRRPPAAGPDADGDGIGDDRDLCSDTPAGAPVWRQGEWLGCAGGQIRDRDREGRGDR